MIPEKRIIRRIQSGGCAIHCQDCSISQLCIPFTLNEHELDQLDNIIERKKPIQKGQTLFKAGDELKSLYLSVEAAQRGRAEISLKGKIRVILLAGKLCRKLLKYAKKQKITSGAIFRTRSGKYLSRRQIWGEMKQLCKTAGVSPEKVYPHNLRHLFARTFYHACKDIARLADVLGHSSIETTRIYLLTTGDEQLRQLDRLGLIS